MDEARTSSAEGEQVSGVVAQEVSATVSQSSRLAEDSSPMEALES